MKKFVIPDRALIAQADAADPDRSVFVSANAGSGKTHVLTERVIRLLLKGTDPSRILCLTYTKAAAAVMKARIFDRLASWTSMSAEKLAEELQHMEGKKPNAARLQTARKLFAHALETPGGLKIQTIHAFCEALLHAFPLEANIAGHFEMMDDVTSDALLQDSRRLLIETAYRGDNKPLQEAFTKVLQEVGESGFESLLSNAIAKRQDMARYLADRTPEDQADFLRQVFALDSDDTPENIINVMVREALLPADMQDIVMRHGGVKSAEFLERLEQLKTAVEPEQKLAAVKEAYFTAAGSPRGLKLIAPKAVREVLPDAVEVLEARQAALQSLLDRLVVLKLIPLNLAAYRLVAFLLDNYANMKRQRGLLDFDDLIYRSLALLKRPGAGQWVQYKLDRGIDHILVDEAQDTSPAQWEIVQLLSSEFFAGSGQRDVERTIFAVGDEKQSIYSFQGAVPQDFAANGRLVSQRVFEAERKFSNIRLDFSFRSTHEVLSAVDHVFALPENYKGLSADNEKTVHEAIRSQDVGAVDIWDVMTPEQVEEPEDWRQPVDQLGAPAVRLAETIADTIAGWLRNGEVLSGQNRLVQPSDIMVLVRKRDQFVPALSRALKNRNIPVAGADRLHLTQHIAIRDLMALGAFVLQPDDDLALASLFKSPLFALQEEDLFRVAVSRKGSLWQEIKDALAQGDMIFKDLVERLTHYRNLADQVPVFEFYSEILSTDGGRRQFLGRLGSEAGDVLDAFLDSTLAIQKSGLPGLQNFLEILRVQAPEIKRELDQNREEVRIMTVHAAKGLEAGIVFLVDSGSRIWNSQHEPKIISLPHGHEQAMLWLPSSALKPQQCIAVIDALKERAEEEYRRLLYVGMTRAEDRLIVCGYRGKTQNDGTWAPMVKAALVPYASESAGPSEKIAAWRYQRKDVASDCIPDIVTQDTEDSIKLPDYFMQKMPSEKVLPRPLTPSSHSWSIEVEDKETVGLIHSPLLQTDSAQTGFAVERGNVIHKLLQYLPDIDPVDHAATIERYIQHRQPNWDGTIVAAIKQQIFALLDHERIRLLFHPQARAEVSIMGTVEIAGRAVPVSGQIDRLRVTESTITIGDFKTGRVPSDRQSLPQSYLTQMALYAALLRPLYPDRRVEALLVYTQGPEVFTIADEALEQILHALATKTPDS